MTNVVCDPRRWPASGEDWRSAVDCIAIDPDYDGVTLRVALADAPLKRTQLVAGAYELPAAGRGRADCGARDRYLGPGQPWPSSTIDRNLMATPVLTVLEEDKHAWFAGRTRAILKYLDAEVGRPVPGKVRKILDIGSGAGNMAHHLAHYGQVFGLDYNPRPLPVAQQRGLPVLQGSGSELPFPDGTFDLVALLDTVEHIPDELGVLYEVCARAQARRQADRHRPGLYVAVELQRRDQRPPAPLHRARTAAEAGAVRAARQPHLATTTSSSSRPLPASALLRPYNPGLKSPHLDQEPDVYQVDMEPIPEPVNTVLHGVGWLEAEILQRGRLPFGVSVIAIAAKAA